MTKLKFIELEHNMFSNDARDEIFRKHRDDYYGIIFHYNKSFKIQLIRNSYRNLFKYHEF